MSKKLEAIQNGRLTYNTGKPCKRGHASDRYTSNGMCIECVKQQNVAIKEVTRIAKQRQVQAMAANLKPHSFMVSDVNREIMQRVADIFQYGTRGLCDELADHINRIYDVCPHPRALSYDDIVKFMKYDGARVTNMHEVQVIYPRDDNNDPHTYVVRNGLFYRAPEVMEVLRGQRLTVIPRTPMF